MNVKVAVRSIVPKWVLNFYHLFWAILANVVYGFPSRKLIVIGVTGTQGKTTVSNMISHALNNLGESCGLLSTATIKIGSKEWLNDLKMTMPGRLTMQKYLRQMIKAGHHYAVVETSSEAIVQWRHWGINYDVAVFTNLTPEHIESHGSFEKYKQAKLKLWKVLSQKPKKKLFGQSIPKVSVVNIDDKLASDFLNFSIPKTYIYGIDVKLSLPQISKISATSVNASRHTLEFKIDETKFNLPIGGRFNVYNSLAAISTLLGLNFSLEKISHALQNFTGTPGRLEFIKAGQPFEVVVDYAHTPESLEAVYQTLSQNEHKPNLIAVLGSCGGGRDKDKRPKLGELAARYAKKVFITNEDPYDEDPQIIIDAVAHGAQAVGKEINRDLFIEPDRRRAISRAINVAQTGDVVVITGKGCEQWLMTSNSKIPWDDRLVVMEEIKKVTSK